MRQRKCYICEKPDSKERLSWMRLEGQCVRHLVHALCADDVNPHGGGRQWSPHTAHTITSRT